MKKEQLKTLQQQMQTHLDILEKRYPLSKIILTSIDTLFYLDADENFIYTWYSGQKDFIRRIKKEIDDIEQEAR